MYTDKSFSVMCCFYCWGYYMYFFQQLMMWRTNLEDQGHVSYHSFQYISYFIHSFRGVLFLLSIHYYFSTFVSSSLFSIYLLCHTTGDINQLRTIHLYARREESITFTMLEEAPPQEDLSSLLVSFTTWSCWVMELLTVIFVMLSWINTA